VERRKRLYDWFSGRNRPFSSGIISLLNATIKISLEFTKRANEAFKIAD